MLHNSNTLSVSLLEKYSSSRTIFVSILGTQHVEKRKQKNLINTSLYKFFAVGCGMELLEKKPESEVVKAN